MTRLSAEDELIQRVLRLEGSSTAALVGDDGAVLTLGSGEVVVTVDQQVADVHFTPDLEPDLLARRTVAVNLSDLAAMGAQPAFGFLTIAAPPDYPVDTVIERVADELTRYKARLAGGDISRSATTTTTLTLVGRPRHRGRWLRRRSGLPGDRLWLGGTVGESAVGRFIVAAGARQRDDEVELPKSVPAALRREADLAVRRHLHPDPQLRLSSWLARQTRSAVIDVSDGLSIDLHRLCRESQVGARIDADRLPTPHRLREISEHLGVIATDLVLGGGEDYVLLFSLAANTEPPDELGCTRIGELTENPEILLERDGEIDDLPASGWDHRS